MTISRSEVAMRNQILKQIDKIESTHCDSCPISCGVYEKHRYCISECEVGERLAEVGNEWISESEKRKEEILSKGRDMTTEEVQYLLNKGYGRRKIGHAIGVYDGSDIKRYFDGLEKQLGGA